MFLHFGTVCPCQVAALAFCFFGPSAFAEGRFWPQVPGIHQHWRCIFPFIALQNLGLRAFAYAVAHAVH
jgi:hypothetical protein